MRQPQSCHSLNPRTFVMTVGCSVVPKALVNHQTQWCRGHNRHLGPKLEWNESKRTETHRRPWAATGEDSHQDSDKKEPWASMDHKLRRSRSHRTLSQKKKRRKKKSSNGPWATIDEESHQAKKKSKKKKALTAHGQRRVVDHDDPWVTKNLSSSRLTVTYKDQVIMDNKPQTDGKPNQRVMSRRLGQDPLWTETQHSRNPKHKGPATVPRRTRTTTD